jgi:hypothetical protein
VFLGGLIGTAMTSCKRPSFTPETADVHRLSEAGHLRGKILITIG